MTEISFLIFSLCLWIDLEGKYNLPLIYLGACSQRSLFVCIPYSLSIYEGLSLWGNRFFPFCFFSTSKPHCMRNLISWFLSLYLEIPDIITKSSQTHYCSPNNSKHLGLTHFQRAAQKESVSFAGMNYTSVSKAMSVNLYPNIHRPDPTTYMYISYHTLRFVSNLMLISITICT